MTGPLAGLRVIEFAGIGPAPYAGMLLADLGADIIRIDRAGAPTHRGDPHLRNRRSIILDLKQPAAIEIALALIARSDATIEGLRPGVMERLGLGPDICLGRNPRLVYGRMTGWGQTGPQSPRAGHDINYIALSGALAAIGQSRADGTKDGGKQGGGRPVPPLNLLGEFAGGGLMLAFGLLAALRHADATGQGQIVDAAIVDGVLNLMSAFHGYRAVGGFARQGPGESFLGGAAHYYGTYETKDGKFIAIGALEPQFYAVMVDLLGLDRSLFDGHSFSFFTRRESPEDWQRLRAAIAASVKTKSRDDWVALSADSDACISPVLTYDEASDHPHLQARQAFVDVGDDRQPAPAPRFSHTPADRPHPPPLPGADTADILHQLGYDAADIAVLRRDGAVQ